jgi:tetratricopeptide (TPR) repeat protein
MLPLAHRYSARFLMTYDATVAVVGPGRSYGCCRRSFGGCTWCGGCCNETMVCFSGAPERCPACGCGSLLRVAPDRDSGNPAIASMLTSVRLTDESVLQAASMVPSVRPSERKTRAVLQLVSLEKPKVESATDFGSAIAHYSKGYSHFWQCRYQAAFDEFSRATQSFPDDARFWYYKGFAELGLGRNEQAEESLGHAVALHSRNQPDDRITADALERIQGEFRQKLREVQLKAKLLPLRPLSPANAETADRVAARP